MGLSRWCNVDLLKDGPFYYILFKEKWAKSSCGSAAFCLNASQRTRERERESEGGPNKDKQREIFNIVNSLYEYVVLLDSFA